MPTFRTTLLATGGNNVGIVVPDEILASFGAGKRVPVAVTIDGSYSYRTTTAVMGGKNLVSFNADTRAKTGRGAGDEVEVTLEHDTAPRTVEVPELLAIALAADPVAAAAWAKLAPSHQKAHVTAILDAKSDDTRNRRVAKAIDVLAGRP